MNLSLGETTSFYRVNAALVIDGIKREKENTFITRRHHHCKIVLVDDFLWYGRRVGFFH
jgi:tetraacyldisaccharide-1-P 4'-kinase